MPSSKLIFQKNRLTLHPLDDEKCFIKFRSNFCSMQENRFLRLLKYATLLFIPTPLSLVANNPPQTFRIIQLKYH